MMRYDLFPVDHQIVSFFGISGNVADRYGQFDTQMGFYRGRDNCVVAEDLLFFVGVQGMSSDADSGIGVFGEFGTAHRHGAIKIDFSHV